MASSMQKQLTYRSSLNFYSIRLVLKSNTLLQTWIRPFLLPVSELLMMDAWLNSAKTLWEKNTTHFICATEWISSKAKSTKKAKNTTPQQYMFFRVIGKIIRLKKPTQCLGTPSQRWIKRSIFYNEIAINWSLPYHLISPVGRDALRNDLTPSILFRKAARSAPEALTISPRGRPKFQTRSPNGHLKLMILRITSCERTTKFPAPSALLKWKRKTFGCRP